MMNSITDNLTRTELRRLVTFKWRYSLESAGFTRDEAAKMVFLKWRVSQRSYNAEGVC